MCIPLDVSRESKNDLVESLKRPGVSLDCPIMSSNGSRGAPNGPADMIFVQNLTPQEFQAKILHSKHADFATLFNHDLDA